MYTQKMENDREEEEEEEEEENRIQSLLTNNI